MPDSQIEEIKARLNIVDVISSYLRLTKAGVNFKGLCPFHSEKTASFMVSPSRQAFYCFGCSEHGDVFTFIQKIEGVDFLQALRTLADRAGVVLKRESPEARSEKSRLYDLSESASRHFELNLENQAVIRDYLKSRGVKEETKKTWRVGYALDSWRGLSDFLRTKDFKDLEIEKAGLAVRQADGRIHDRFRHRLMFPIFDSSSRVVGFSGRNLCDIMPAQTERADSGKYVNSPETVLFSKSRILYGFDKAKTEIRKAGQAILVEGQFDLILPWQDGIKNIVATSGTALTSGHLEVLKRLTDSLVLAFDTDEAGFRATKKGVDLALELGFNVKIASLGEKDGQGETETKDPADFVNKHPGKIQERINSAKPIIDHFIVQALEKWNPATLEGKKSITQNLLPEIKRLANAIDRGFWIRELAAKIGVPEKDLEIELAKISINQDAPYEFVQTQSEALGVKKIRKEVLSERLLALILGHPSLIGRIPEFLDLLFMPYGDIARALIPAKEDFNIKKLPETFPREFHPQLDYLTLVSDVVYADLDEHFNAQKEFEFLLEELKKENAREALVDLEVKIKKAEKEENLSLLNSLLNEFQKWLKRK